MDYVKSFEILWTFEQYLSIMYNLQYNTHYYLYLLDLIIKTQYIS